MFSWDLKKSVKISLAASLWPMKSSDKGATSGPSFVPGRMFTKGLSKCAPVTRYWSFAIEHVDIFMVIYGDLMVIFHGM